MAASFGAAVILSPGLIRIMKKTKKISIELNETEHAVVAMWAERASMPVKDYIKKLAVDMPPPPALTETKDRNDREVALERAFGALDSWDLQPAPGVIPLPPARKQVAGGITEAERTHPLQRLDKAPNLKLPTVPSGPHPCIHLGAAPSHLRGQCQGTCQHRDQTGRICYWPPASARNCMLFDSKMGR